MGAVGCRRENDTLKRRECRGNTSQGPEASMSAPPGGQQPRDPGRRLAVTACLCPEAAG